MSTAQLPSSILLLVFLSLATTTNLVLADEFEDSMLRSFEDAASPPTESYLYSEEPLFTDEQATVLSYLHYVSAPLSAVGSFVIIHSLLTTRQSSLRPPFRRLMLALSMNDLITSLTWIFMVPLASPQYQENYVHGAHGNFTTCSIMGFFLNYNLGSCLYSAFLALYFLFQVRFEMKAHTFAMYMEPWFHLVGLSVPLITGLYATITQNMNPIATAPGTCWIRPYPAGCNHPDSTLECTRGGSKGHSVNTARLLGTGVSILSFGVILISMCLLVVKVLQTERKMHRYMGNNLMPMGNSSMVGDSRRTRRSSTLTLRGLKRTKMCGIQALYYVLAFFISFFPLVLLQLKPDVAENRGYYLVVTAVFKILHPAQGFSNCLVYLKKSGAKLTLDWGSVWRTLACFCTWWCCCCFHPQTELDEDEIDVASTGTPISINISSIIRSGVHGSGRIPAQVWANLTEESEICVTSPCLDNSMVALNLDVLKRSGVHAPSSVEGGEEEESNSSDEEYWLEEARKPRRSWVFGNKQKTEDNKTAVVSSTLSQPSERDLQKMRNSMEFDQATSKPSKSWLPLFGHKPKAPSSLPTKEENNNNNDEYSLEEARKPRRSWVFGNKDTSEDHHKSASLWSSTKSQPSERALQQMRASMDGETKKPLMSWLPLFGHKPKTSSPPKDQGDILLLRTSSKSQLSEAKQPKRQEDDKAKELHESNTTHVSDAEQSQLQQLASQEEEEKMEEPYSEGTA